MPCSLHSGHSSWYLRQNSVTVAVMSQTLLEKPQRSRQISKRRPIAQRTGLAFDEWDRMLPVKTDMISIKEALVAGNHRVIGDNHDPGRI